MQTWQQQSGHLCIMSAGALVQKRSHTNIGTAIGMFVLNGIAYHCWHSLNRCADCSLNYDDLVCNNFYDIWGEFPEATQSEKTLPTLAALQRLGSSSNDNREVCLLHVTSFLTKQVTARTIRIIKGLLQRCSSYPHHSYPAGACYSS